MSQRTPVLNRSKMGRIRHEFDYIRRRFFPGWDRTYQWKIGWFDECPLLHNYQVTDCKGKPVYRNEIRLVGEEEILLRAERGFIASTIAKCKAILFRRNSINDFGSPRLRSLIVHEICHAVLTRQDYGEDIGQGWYHQGWYHREHWQKRMRKAALLAEELEQPLLAYFIESDIKREVFGPGNRQDLEWITFLLGGWEEEDYQSL